MDQTVESVEDYLINMRQVSDALYYNIIKESDMSSESDKMHNGMNLLYEANKENLRSIAIYNQYGSLLEAEPVVAQKEDPNVTKQDWFIQAMNQMENIHFSTPHVQNLFDDGTQQYYWVISSSRVVELTDGTNTQLGVLLVDMDYSGISRMMERINTTDSGQYFYLCDSNGQIIYHPHQVQLDNGMKKESSKKAARAKESVYEERINGEHREIAIESAKTAKIFGIDPKVAMLSYSTLGSGKGPSVTKVANATKKIKEAAPELAVEGEIQFDASVSPEVAEVKCPGSPVAGQANTFIFPDINAANIGYKIASRLGGYTAVGPVLQGLNAPINDLSRGCNAEEVYSMSIVTAALSVPEEEKVDEEGLEAIVRAVVETMLAAKKLDK